MRRNEIYSEKEAFEKKAKRKEKVMTMKKRFFKKGMLFGALVAVAAGAFVFGGRKDADAATRKCYTISSGNTTVYSNSCLSSRYGTIFGSDELTVQDVTGRYCRVTYPVSRGTKTGYIPTGAILTGTTGNDYRARGRVTTYKRPGGASYGYIDANDTVKVLGTYGSYTQVKYPVSGGYKYAFITTSNANAYIYSQQQTVTVAPAANNNTDLGSPVPSGCRFNRKTYDNGWYGFHDINIGVSTATPVYAIADGTVTYKQAYRLLSGVCKLTSYGNFIEFRSSNGVYNAKYCHLNRFVGNSYLYIQSYNTRQVSGSEGTLSCGTKYVRKGEIIGYIGQTGNASGVHLHFELRKNGTRIDPTSVISGLY